MLEQPTTQFVQTNGTAKVQTDASGRHQVYKPSTTLIRSMNLDVASPKTSAGSNDVENGVIDNIILPTAKLSNDILHLDEIIEAKTLKPDDAYSYQERLLLSFADDNDRKRFKSVIRGAMIGSLSGLIISGFVVPFSIAFSKRGKTEPSQVIKYKQLSKFVKHYATEFFTRGTKRYSENIERSIIRELVKDTSFGTFTGIMLSLNQSHEQSSHADVLAYKMHEQVELEKKSGEHLKHHATYHQIPRDYHKWQENVTSWQNNLRSALFFNFITTTGVLLAQGLAAGAAMGMVKSNRLTLVKDLTQGTNTLLKGNTLMSKAAAFVFPDLESHTNDLLEHKDNEDKLNALAERKLRHFMHDQFVNKYNLVNVSRLAILSVLSSMALAIQNARHLNNIRSQVRDEMIENRRQALANNVDISTFPPIPGIDANVTVLKQKEFNPQR